MKNKIKRDKSDKKYYLDKNTNVLKSSRDISRELLYPTLIKNSKITNSPLLKSRLYLHNLKENVCEECGISEWRGIEIPMELHHINHIRNDNRLENLQILCPNCHFMHHYLDRLDKKSKKTKNLCETCKCEISRTSKNCKMCQNRISATKRRKVKWPTKEVLESELKNTPMVKLGEKYGVSDNAVRKWARHYGLL